VTFNVRISEHVDGNLQWCVSRDLAGACNWIPLLDPGHLTLSIGATVTGVPEVHAHWLTLGGLMTIYLLSMKRKIFKMPH
jgi:hypothetical protein